MKKSVLVWSRFGGGIIPLARFSLCVVILCCIVFFPRIHVYAENPLEGGMVGLSDKVIPVGPRYFLDWFNLDYDYQVPESGVPFKVTGRFTALLWDIEDVTLCFRLFGKLKFADGTQTWTGTVQKGETKTIEMRLIAPPWQEWETDLGAPKAGIPDSLRIPGHLSFVFVTGYPYEKLLLYVEKHKKELFDKEKLRTILLGDLEKQHKESKTKGKFEYGKGCPISVLKETHNFPAPALASPSKRIEEK